MPKPAGSDSYDANHDGHFDLRDYENDPRVNPPCPDGTAPYVKHEEGTTRSCVPGGQHAYLHAMDRVLLVCAVVALVGAVTAAAFLPARAPSAAARPAGEEESAHELARLA